MTSKQRAYLRGLASTLSPIFQVGKNGVTDLLVQELDHAIGARELIKIHILETAPEHTSVIANKLSSLLQAELIQVLGNKITLFRARKENPKIILP